jgi:hypothetical protein
VETVNFPLLAPVVILRHISEYIRQMTQGDHVKDDWMGGACSTHGRDEKCMQDFCRKT